MNNKYTKALDVFTDDNIRHFINLDQAGMAYKRIVDSIEKPMKLLLLYGNPGTGKTFLLQKIYADYKNEKRLVFINQPCFDEKSFYNAITSQLKLNKQAEDVHGFIALLNSIEPIVVLLDEVQLYPDDLIEKIRLIADTKLVKFVIAVHKHQKEDIFIREYFSTRLWDSIELKNPNFNEFETYISKKFMLFSMFDYFNAYSNSNLKLVHRLTNGNLRNANKLLHKLYEIYEFYEANNPKMIKPTTIEKKYIIMAAISIGVINA